MNQPPQPQQPPSQPPRPPQAPGQPSQPQGGGPGYGYPQQPVAPQQQMGVGAPQPVPGQAPAPGYPPPMGGQPPYPGAGPQGAPGHMPYPGSTMGQRPKSGSPVGAFFLGLLASFVVAAVYTLVFVFTPLADTRASVNTLFFVHAVVNGAVVGWLVGMVGRRRTGAYTGGAVVAALGSFFGFTNAMPLFAWQVGGFDAVFNMVKMTPLYPLEAWWGPDGTGHFVAILSLVVAAAAAWGVAFAVGRKRG